jgi:hypothetical protein
MAKNQSPEEIIKDALSEIYDLKRIDGLLIVGITSEAGAYSARGRMLGSPLSRVRMIAQVLYKTAEAFDMSESDILRMLNGMMVEAGLANKHGLKKSLPGGGSTYTITKM